ncbi:type III secretion protein J [Pseudoduganella flava]|uniref:Lipoprotein n=1 Tax=Pseudoduganella flava TaxID=871742 RepID=A0A562PDR9_9BURK|nr:type III secretion inner membrane ring lipoprotein SctJ [Pseudoduganella flava]QGZ42143.1 EscJ/YscJ/HrcJ family type III secretion inner membrane ring protein [Pseudoduganella flava]TWI42483.1 type III secretion protein J [Pseudoduganella flava]
MTMGARKLCAALLLAAMLAGCGKNVTLQAALQDADANEIVLQLTGAGIVAEKHQDKAGVSVLVAEADIPRATAVLQAAGLPRRSRANLGEVFKKQGMISSPMEERIRYLHGLSEELEATLQQFDNVVAARVHVVLPERIAPGEPIQPSSASVFIKYRPPMDEDALAPRVRKLVASAIPGLVGEDGRSKVTVVLTPSEAAAPAVEWAMVGPFKTEAHSVAALRWTLIGMGTLLALAAGYALFTVARRHPAVARLLAKRAKGKVPAAAGAAG